MGLGGIAVFMGLAVLLASLSSGKVSYSMVQDGKTVTTSLEKATDANGYWAALGWTAALPMVFGLIAVFGGRRVLKG